MTYPAIPFVGTEKAMAVLLTAKSEWLDTTLKKVLMGLGYNLDERAKQLLKSRKKLKELRKLPVIEQRSESWYKIRQELLTASDLAQALGKGKFGNRNQLLAKKANIGQEGGGAFGAGIPHLKWGVMYEPVAQRCYQKMHDDIPIFEFGLIQHPTFPIFGASPDGITSLGTMLEIKCPYQRKIVAGEVPEQYHLQIQGQLEVCDLEECDYLECEFKEYSKDEAQEIARDGNRYMGVIYECYTQQDAGPLDAYIYSPVFEGNNGEAFQIWDTENGTKMSDSILRRHYWVLTKINLVRVNRDRQLFAQVKPDIEKFWKDVQEARKTGVVQGMAPKRGADGELVKSKAKKVDKQAFAFVDD